MEFHYEFSISLCAVLAAVLLSVIQPANSETRPQTFRVNYDLELTDGAETTSVRSRAQSHEGETLRVLAKPFCVHLVLTSKSRDLFRAQLLLRESANDSDCESLTVDHSIIPDSLSFDGEFGIPNNFQVRVPARKLTLRLSLAVSKQN